MSPLAFPPLCAGEPVEVDPGLFIDGVTDEQHQWVEGEPYEAPNPEDGQPARWSNLVCERCGAVVAGWSRLRSPESDG